MVHVPATVAEVRQAGHQAAARLTRAIAALAAALGKERDPAELVGWLSHAAEQAESLVAIYSPDR